VNPILAGVAIAVVGGAVLVVSVRDCRVAVLGVAVVLLLSAALTDPVASPTALAARALGAILGTYLLWIAARERPDVGLPPAPTEGSRIGWPAETLLAAAAFVAGFAAHGLGAPAQGSALASAAGFAVAALAVAPMLTGRDVLRVGLGLLLVLDAALLVRAGLGGTPDALEQLLTAGMLATVAAAIAAVAMAARSDGVGGFDFAPDLTSRRPTRVPDAHPIHGEPGDRRADRRAAGPADRR
jgi:hypothetical protein